MNLASFECGVGPLHRAKTADDVERLVGDGFDVDARDAWGRTPLFVVLECWGEGAWQVAMALVGMGADPWLSAGDGRKVLEMVPPEAEGLEGELVSAREGWLMEKGLADGMGKGPSPGL